MVTHPLVLFSASFLAIFLVGGAAFTVYRPMFNAYRDGCVLQDEDTGQPVGDGTWIARNAYAIAYNYASHDGNKARLKGLDSFVLEQQEICARQGEKSANDEADVQAEMDMIVGSHRRTQNDVFLMRQCYDTSYLATEWVDNSTGLPPVDSFTGGAFPLLSATLADANCDVMLSNETLEEGTFDCTQMSPCTVPCNDLADESGVDNSDLRAIARTAMCTVQWWFHSMVLRFIFSVFIWVFLNLFRRLLMEGLVRCCWQYLNSGKFTILATANADGVTTFKEQDVSDKIYDLISSMRMRGALLILVALLTQIPWIFALYTFANGVDPGNILDDVL
jgi:hypothetical protein